MNKKMNILKEKLPKNAEKSICATEGDNGARE